MHRLLVILLVSVMSVNSLVQPGSFTQSFCLLDMYKQCSEEDPDINPLDFVFEHLLNLESVMEYFEGEETEEGEHPHAPYQAVQSSAQIAVAMPKPIQPVFHSRNEYPTEKTVYPIQKEAFYLDDFHADILRPPIV